MALDNPFFEPLLIVAQRQIPVFGRALHKAVPRVVLVGWVDEFVGRKSCAALLALVAVSAREMAARALAHNVAVGQELARLLVAELLLGLLLKQTVVVEFAEEIGGKLMVYGRCGAAIDVERDAELLKRFFNQIVVAVHHLLHRDALFLRADGNGHAVLVASADEHNLTSACAKIACVDVGRHINPGQMPDVHRPVGVRQSRCDCVSFIFSHNLEILVRK